MTEANDITLFEVPATFELIKSEGNSGRRMVRGYASMEHEDQSGETIIQRGIDFSPLLKSGFLNYDHQYVSTAPGIRMPTIVGYPTSAELREKGLWVEGELLKSEDPAPASHQLKIANELWELGLAFQKSGGQRSLAYSVEGAVTERRGQKIVKSIVKHLAITHKPVLAEATLEVFMKSKLCCGKCSPDHPDYNPAHKCPSHNKQIHFTNGIPHLAAAMEKALATDNSGPITTERPSPLIRENIDRGLTSVLYGDVDCDKHYDRATGRFFKGVSGAVEHMTDCLGYSRDESTRLLKRLLNGTDKSAELLTLVKTAGFIRQ